MRITNDKGCGVAECAVDLSAICKHPVILCPSSELTRKGYAGPEELRGHIGADNETLDCNPGCALESNHGQPASSSAEPGATSGANGRFHRRFGDVLYRQP
jgi:hypothetical protein